jgi:hypothetical protein
MSRLLDEHGTSLHELKPISIIDAAKADLRRRQGNRGTGREHYAFHRLHVRKASDPAELLAVALRDRQRGLTSGKRWTRLIYGDEPLLQRALELARPAPIESASA